MLLLRDVTVHYEKVKAISGVSMQIDKNEIVAVLGANGAGKTTLLRAISGLKRLTNGEIWFKDVRIDGKPAHHIVKMGIAHVPEGRRIFPYMSVMENLMMGAYSCRNSNTVKNSLGFVYEHFPILKERSNQRAGSLSGGQQQMLAIGRALMAQPKLLLMDEPSMGLSPLMTREISKVVRTISQEGISILLVEQNVAMALKVAHRGYVLQVSKVVVQGDIDTLTQNDLVKKAYLGG